MKKPLVVVSCPIDTYSGYGARSRDFVESLLKCKGKDWNIRILPQRWGNTRVGYLKDHNKEDIIKLCIPSTNQKPRVWIQITVPNEFQPVGDYNIGVTAAMETTLCHNTWIQGVNRMDLVLTSSQHSKESLVKSEFDFENKQTGEKGKLKVVKPVEVLFEGVKLDTYSSEISKGGNVELIDSLDTIKESFCFLAVGHWLQGEHKQDRKNISGMIQTFLETFKTQLNKPALILKTQSFSSSIMDRENILKKISQIRQLVKGSLPNIYLLHGELSDDDINTLYNHRKVKAMISLTRGEGFGRPLLEFTTTGKPIVASGWSGQVDFLRNDLSFLVAGKLENVHASAVVKDMILPEAKWFTYDDNHAKKLIKLVYKQYKKALARGKKQRVMTNKYFTFEKMTEKLNEYVDKYVPFFPVENTFIPPAPSEIKIPKKIKK